MFGTEYRTHRRRRVVRDIASRWWGMGGGCVQALK